MLQTGAGEGNEKGTVGFGRSAIVDSGAIEFDTEAGEFAFGINEKLGGDFLKAEFFTEDEFLIEFPDGRIFGSEVPFSLAKGGERFFKNNAIV